MTRVVAEERKVKTKRPLGFVLLGIVLLVGAGALIYDVRSRSVDTVNLPSVYEYKVSQQLDTDAAYRKSAYYDGAPGFGNTAYISELTDMLKLKYRYTYYATREAELTTTFLVSASVRGRYVVGVDGKDSKNVWSKDHRVIPAETSTSMTKSITIEKEFEVPYAEYRQAIDQFKSSLQVPVMSDVQIVISTRVSGTIDDSPIDDQRTAVISAPLDQPLFAVTAKYDKDDKKQVAGRAAKDTQATIRSAERIGAGVLALLGIVSITYGMRRQIFKSAYQRELDKIYRYHDGIIIKARKSADFSKKSIVPVQTFDDMLNLEEELKLPIVAVPAGPTATQFVIVREDIAFVYTLGKETTDGLHNATTEDLDEIFLKHSNTTRRHTK